MYIVTGGAGFIGSNLVRRLLELGYRVLVVDDRSDRARIERNLAGCDVGGCLDKDVFLDAIRLGQSFGRVDGVFHQGACADTTCTDRWLLWRDNFQYSVTLLDWAQRESIPLVYASSAAVYGASTHFTESPENERPLNGYAWSKLLFDRHVRRTPWNARSTVVGLRYFNVYGPAEAHKGRMASMVWQLWRQLVQTDEARLFEGSGGFADGEQRRDFVHVSDVVAVNLHFMLAPPQRAIVNVGTGRSRSFNDVARALISHRGRGTIRYIPMPDPIRNAYQSFTEADLAGLRQAGCTHEFLDLETGLARSVAAWSA